MQQRGAALLTTLEPGARDWSIARTCVLVSLLVLVACAPFAKLQLPAVPAFIPIYQSALVVNDLITAVLLFGQFGILRSRALMVLACGYLFTAAMTVAHTLSFPELFAPGGWLSGGPQTTAWLYVFWHAGFPLFVMGYAMTKGRPSLPLQRHPVAWTGATAALALAIGFALLATAGHDLLPPLMRGGGYLPGTVFAMAGMWACSLVALVVLWRRRPHSMLDLWLMVVLCAWMCDMALATVLNAGRFDVGFYAGRIYGLLAASVVLVLLLLESGALHARLVQAHALERQRRSELQGLGRMLEDVNAQLAERNRELEESSRLKSEFLANMSHELRTPLNAVIGFSEMLKDGHAGALSPRQQDFIGHVHDSGRHLLSMINDILDLSKVEAGKVELEFEPVDVDELLSTGIARLAERAQAARLLVLRAPGPKLGLARADRRRLRQILDNLLSNALKFTPEGGRVELRATLVDRRRAAEAMPGFDRGMRMPLPEGQGDRFIEISVMDSGIGMSAEDAVRLFTPFTQIAHPRRRNLEGTGLGLAMVRRLAELHGGTVCVTSEPERGSCFTVWLPWQPEVAPQPVAAMSTQPAFVPPGGEGPLALVVEDDDKAAALMREQLEGEGFRVLRVASAEEALALVDDCTPDLITLDILLPGMDGWEFLEQVKELPDWDTVPVVVVSVAPDDGRGISLGASLVLQKPVGREALAKGLSRLGLHPHGPRAPTVLVVDDDARAVEVLSGYLQQSGHEVLRALGGRDGIAMAERFRPDAIALDLEMPDLNGFEVVEALKANPDTAQIPVIVVTAKHLSERERRHLNGQIQEIVAKSSFNHGGFIGEVQRAMSRPAA